MNLKREEVLVFGGAGYIGSHVCLEFLKSGFDVVLVDSKSLKHLNRVNETFFDLCSKKANIYSLHVTNEKDLNFVFENHNIELVVDLAGVKSTVAFQHNPVDSFYSDTNLALTLLKAMKLNSVKKIIFASSVLVYSLKEGVIDETSPTSTQSPYSLSKLFLEGVLENIFSSDSEWQVLILRIFNTAGVHSSGMIGDNWPNVPKNLFNNIISQLKGYDEKIVINGLDYDTLDGSCQRDYVHVEDVASAFRLGAISILENNISGSEIINVCSGSLFSVLQIIEIFENELDTNISKIISNRRDLDIPFICGSYASANKLLKWSPKYNMRDICQHLIAYHKLQ